MKRELPEGLEELRRRIDALDRHIVHLLNKRSRCAVEIGRIKGKSGLPIYDPQREHEILESIVRTSEGPLAADAVMRLFERILDESRRLERLTNAQEENAGEEESG